MMAGENGPAEVVEPLGTAMALVPLPMGLGVIPAVLGNLGAVALGAAHAPGPTHGTDGLEAFGVVDKGLDVDHRRASLEQSGVAVARIRLSGRAYPQDNAIGTTTPESRMSQED